jgi:hypothetical protein
VLFVKTKNTAASKLPRKGSLLIQLSWQPFGQKIEMPRLFLKKQGASIENEGFEFIIQNPRQAA